MFDLVARGRVLLTWIPFGVLALGGALAFAADHPGLAWAAIGVAGGILWREILHVVETKMDA